MSNHPKRPQAVFFVACMSIATIAFSGVAFADREQCYKDVANRSDAYYRQALAKRVAIEAEFNKDQIKCGTNNTSCINAAFDKRDAAYDEVKIEDADARARFSIERTACEAPAAVTATTTTLLTGGVTETRTPDPVPLPPPTIGQRVPPPEPVKIPAPPLVPIVPVPAPAPPAPAPVGPNPSPSPQPRPTPARSPNPAPKALTGGIRESGVDWDPWTRAWFQTVDGLVNQPVSAFFTGQGDTKQHVCKLSLKLTSLRAGQPPSSSWGPPKVSRGSEDYCRSIVNLMRAMSTNGQIPAFPPGTKCVTVARTITFRFRADVRGAQGQPPTEARPPNC